MKTSTSETEAFNYIIDLIYERCRIRLHQGKEALIRARLGKRMRHHGFTDLVEYCDFLRTRADQTEFTLVVDSLTTNFTNFMREESHFKFLVEKALPSLLVTGRRKMNIWSAAGSSGEEAYTIGFFLAEHYSLDEGWDWRITASDISTKVLAKGRDAIYAEDRLQPLPRDWVRKYFQKGEGRWDGHYRVKPQITERVDFRQINLVENYSHPGLFEVIFCRNVMIYFDRPTQARLINQLCRFLVPGGYVFIGHSESLNGLDVPVRCLSPSIYQKPRA